MEALEALLMMTVSGESGDIARATAEIMGMSGSAEFVMGLVKLFGETRNGAVRKLCCLFLMKELPGTWKVMDAGTRGAVYEAMLGMVRATAGEECCAWVVEGLCGIVGLAPETAERTTRELVALVNDPKLMKPVLKVACRMSFDEVGMEALGSAVTRALESGDHELIVCAAEFLRSCDWSECLRDAYAKLAVLSRTFVDFDPAEQKVLWCAISAIVDRGLVWGDSLLVVVQSAFSVAKEASWSPDLRLLAMAVFENEVVLKAVDEKIALEILETSFELASAVVDTDGIVPKDALSVVDTLFECLDKARLYSVLKSQIIQNLHCANVVRQIVSVTAFSILCSRVPDHVREDESLFTETINFSFASESDLLRESACNAILSLDSSHYLILRYSHDLLKVFLPVLVQWLSTDNPLTSVGIQLFEELAQAVDSPCSGIVDQLWAILPRVSHERRLDVVNCLATALTIDRNVDPSLQPEIFQFVSDQLKNRETELYGYSLVILAGLVNSDTFDFDPFEHVGAERLGSTNVELTFLHNYTLAVQSSHIDFLQSQIPWLMSHMDDDWLDDRLTAAATCSMIIKMSGSREAAEAFYNLCREVWDTEKPRTMEAYVDAINTVIDLVSAEKQSDYLTLIVRCLDRSLSEGDDVSLFCKAIYKVTKANHTIPAVVPHVMSTMQSLLAFDLDAEKSKALKYLVSGLWKTEFHAEVFSLCLNNVAEERNMKRCDALHALTKLVTSEPPVSSEEAQTLALLVTGLIASNPKDDGILDSSLLLLALLERTSIQIQCSDRCCTTLLSWMEQAASTPCGYKELQYTLACVILRLSRHITFPDAVLHQALHSFRTCDTKLARNIVTAFLSTTGIPSTELTSVIATLAPPALSRRRITADLVQALKARATHHV